MMIYRVQASILTIALVLFGLVTFSNSSDDLVIEKSNIEGQNQSDLLSNDLMLGGFEVEKSAVKYFITVAFEHFQSSLGYFVEIVGEYSINNSARGLHYSRGPPQSA